MKLVLLIVGVGIWIVAIALTAYLWPMQTANMQHEALTKLLVIPAATACLPLLAIPLGIFYGILGGAPATSIGYYSGLVWRFKYWFLVVGMGLGGILTLNLITSN